MRRLTALIAAALGILSRPALACSPIHQTFAELAPRAALAIRARPTFQFTARDYDVSETHDGRLAGRVTFDRIVCHHRAKGIGPCPKTLTVDFDYALDGINCPPDINAIDPERLRYFTFWRDETGAWQIDSADHFFDR